jgi:hypothetical protein
MSALEQARENFYVDRGLARLPLDEIRKLKLEANIVLGDFVFNTIDDDGVVWVITDIGGWWRPPDADMPDVPRGYGDGSYDMQGRYVARELSLTGVFLVSDPAQVEAARDRLVAATDLVYRGAWLKTGTDPIRASWVRLSGGTQITTTTARGRTEFSIGLRAPDPIKYLWNSAHPEGYSVVEIPVRNVLYPSYGSETIENVGNYTVPCVLEVVGPLRGPATVLNDTTGKLVILTSGLNGALAKSVSNKQRSFNTTNLVDVVTLTTTTNHGFFVGDSVVVGGVGSGFDGDQVVSSTPTDTTFTYETSASTIHDVIYKGLTSNVATIETILDHDFSPGDPVVVVGVDSVFNGSYVVLSTPTTSSLTYARTRVTSRAISGCVLVSNIATLTTVDPHEFIVGDSVTVSGVGTNYDGTHTIVSISSPTQFGYVATRTNERAVDGYYMNDDAVTIRTTATHGFIQGENTNISGVTASLDGGYRISSIVSPTQFRYERSRVTEVVVTTKAISPSNVATLTTRTAHNFVVGERIIVRGVGSDLDGTYTITAVPTSTTLSYSKTAPFLVSTPVPAGTVRARSRVIKNRQLVANEVTMVTNNPHGIIVGEQVTITGVGAPFDGTYVVTRNPSLTSFVYSRVNADVALANAPTTSRVEMLGRTPNGNLGTFVSLSPNGTAVVSGSVPFASSTGTAVVVPDIARTLSPGRAVRPDDVAFTASGLSSATIIRNADVLEIDTQNKEVTFNGSNEGARARVDVLTDFIELAPGENRIAFEDVGNPESEATLRIYYRSGWLS